MTTTRCCCRVVTGCSAPYLAQALRFAVITFSAVYDTTVHNSVPVLGEMNYAGHLLREVQTAGELFKISGYTAKGVTRPLIKALTAGFT